MLTRFRGTLGHYNHNEYLDKRNRNSSRFPSDFAWTLTSNEWAALRSQFATLKAGPGQHRKYLPTVFTEHGAIMAATLLNSPRAVQMSVYVVRAFVQQRELLSSNQELARQLHALEERIEKKLGRHDRAIALEIAAAGQHSLLIL